MFQIDAEIDRFLTLLRNKIRERGFTQLEVQETLGWGKSYISQLLTKQKTLKVEQVLLIAQVLGIAPEDFFAELYADRRPRRGVAPRVDPSAGSEPAPAPWPELEEQRALLAGLVAVLAEKGLVARDEVEKAARARI